MLSLFRYDIKWLNWSCSSLVFFFCLFLRRRFPFSLVSHWKINFNNRLKITIKSTIATSMNELPDLFFPLESYMQIYEHWIPNVNERIEGKEEEEKKKYCKLNEKKNEEERKAKIRAAHQSALMIDREDLMFVHPSWCNFLFC